MHSNIYTYFHRWNNSFTKYLRNRHSRWDNISNHKLCHVYRPSTHTSCGTTFDGRKFSYFNFSQWNPLKAIQFGICMEVLIIIYRVSLYFNLEFCFSYLIRLWGTSTDPEANRPFYIVLEFMSIISIPKLQRWNCWCLGMHKWFHHSKIGPRLLMIMSAFQTLC